MSDETRLRPLGDGVLVKVFPAGEVSKGGIVIPEAAQKRPRRGVVLAVGPGRWESDGQGGSWHRPVDVLPDKVVLFSEFAGVEVGEGLLLLRESDLLAVDESETPRQAGTWQVERDVGTDASPRWEAVERCATMAEARQRAKGMSAVSDRRYRVTEVAPPG